MGNSALVSYTRISPFKTVPRKNKIQKITLHHSAGIDTLESLGNTFQNKTRECSANYGIDGNGRIGMYVEEKDRAWTSSSPDNDNQAITIEIANSGKEPQWLVSDAAIAATIRLCVDICKRNMIPELIYTNDAKGNLTRHNMFSATTCPGPYLQSKFPYIAAEVNKQLKPTQPGTGDNPSFWAKEATSWAKEIGLFKGDGKGNFDWQGDLSREMAAMLFFDFYKLIRK